MRLWQKDLLVLRIPIDIKNAVEKVRKVLATCSDEQKAAWLLVIVDAVVDTPPPIAAIWPPPYLR